MASRLREFVSSIGETQAEGQRYHSEEEINMPDDVSDPHVWKDESKRGRREFLAQHKLFIITLSFASIVVVAILAIWARSLIPQIVRNELAREAFAAIVLVIGSVYMGSRWQLSKVRNIDWLVLVEPDGVKRFLGYYTEAEEGDKMFIPVKGFDFFGLRGRRMTLGDMSNEMARQFAKGSRRAEDEVKIRLHPGLCVVRQTSTGTVVAQLSGGLEPDEHGRETDIEATISDVADEEHMQKVRKELERQVAENAYLKDQVSMLETQKKNYKELALETEGEVQDRIVNIIERVEQARSGMGGGMGMATAAPEPDHGGLEEEVDEELNDEY